MVEEVVAWSNHLSTIASRVVRQDENTTENVHIIEHQAAVIDQLIKVTTSQADRLRQLEMKVGVQTSHDMSNLQALPTSVVAPEKTTAKRMTTTLSKAWYEWFAGRAYITEEDRQWKSTIRRCVLYMMLFAHELYLDEEADDFRNKVLSAGHELHDKMIKFLDRFQVCNVGGDNREEDAITTQHELIVDFNARVLAGLVRDPTPRVHRGQALVPVEASA
ncbi:hypothetical protein AeNC1_007672 [Aphanomyces euteiches]|nr:hypothetical protein AeNC1_007672 [Aphanomyces euteiches]